MARALIFPGQGSQTVGMGRALADAFPLAREVFQEVDDALGQKLSKLMWEGPMETLTLTVNAQPALMAVSLAAMRALEREFGVPASKAEPVTCSVSYSVPASRPPISICSVLFRS